MAEQKSAEMASHIPTQYTTAPNLCTDTPPRLSHNMHQYANTPEPELDILLNCSIAGFSQFTLGGIGDPDIE